MIDLSQGSRRKVRCSESCHWQRMTRNYAAPRLAALCRVSRRLRSLRLFRELQRVKWGWLVIGTRSSSASFGRRSSRPTRRMNQQPGTSPASSDDAWNQTQGKPTAAQQAEGGKAKDNDC